MTASPMSTSQYTFSPPPLNGALVRLTVSHVLKLTGLLYMAALLHDCVHVL